ncbi:hypothetical protein [Ilumatobacter sp.]|uniref:hypothetical protein n=1 Tax=Ilumatobacter sp. TaxID=1967498 RepID=UPI00375093C1
MGRSCHVSTPGSRGPAGIYNERGSTMGLKTGERISLDDLGIEVIVTAGGDGSLTTEVSEESLLPGKRFSCETCGAQVLILGRGAGRLICHESPMEIQEPKKSKAAD